MTVNYGSMTADAARCIKRIFHVLHVYDVCNCCTTRLSLVEVRVWRVNCRQTGAVSGMQQCTRTIVCCWFVVETMTWSVWRQQTSSTTFFYGHRITEQCTAAVWYNLTMLRQTTKLTDVHRCTQHLFFVKHNSKMLYLDERSTCMHSLSTCKSQM